MARYADLAHLSQQERGEISVQICNFFSVMNNENMRKELGLPVDLNMIKALPVSKFFEWMKKNGKDLGPQTQRTFELILALEQKGILTPAGMDGSAPRYAQCYCFIYELSTIARKGLLWLGVSLGVDFIGESMKTVIALITGTTKQQDASMGTGTLILPGVVLTCAHVVDDMRLDETLIINGRNYKIAKHISHDLFDVAVIMLEENVAPALADIAFRDSRILEEVVIAGYPPIPRGVSPVLTLHRGEIIGQVGTMDKYPLDLFSAIARPGNSGGPVTALDGRITGMVTRSLERQQEREDTMPPLPFFAAVPAGIVRDAVEELTDMNLPWEDYQ